MRVHIVLYNYDIPRSIIDWILGKPRPAAGFRVVPLPKQVIVCNDLNESIPLLGFED